MKRFLSQRLSLGLLLLMASVSASWSAPAGGGQKGPVEIARLHSAGFREWSADSGGRVFKEIWALPASAQLRQGFLDKLSLHLARTLEGKSGDPAECARLLRPLLTDLGTAEWCLEVREHPLDVFESTLALRLDEARTRAWESAWSTLLSKGQAPSANRPVAISVLSTNQWFALHLVRGTNAAAVGSPGGSPLLNRLRQGLAPVDGPRNYWFSLDADLARWSRWMTPAVPGDLPRIQMTVSGRKENLRSEGRLLYPEPLGVKIEKWEIPMGMIRDPLVSFTAIQGIAPWLQRFPLIQQLGLAAPPGQLYLWGSSQTVFQLQGAAPTANADLAFKRMAEKWVPKFNATLSEYAVGGIVPLPDRSELVWRGLPLLVPYLQTARDGDRDFLHFGIFPVNPPTNAPPPQLFQQLTSQKNLVYYDWEITQARLAQLRSLHQLAGVFLNFAPMSTNSSSFKWLDAIEPRLGNSVTEITMASPQELQFQRTSHLGLNGLELLGLTTWLEGTNFPKINLNAGFRPVVRSPK